jgi:hypothetical protein
MPWGEVGGESPGCSISAFVNLPTVERTMLQRVIKKELENSLLEENSQIKHLSAL